MNAGDGSGAPKRRFPLSWERVSQGAAHTPGSGPRPAGGARHTPQGPLAMAAQHQKRSHTPSGLGLDGDAVRERMVARLQAEGLNDDAVLQAFRRVPRHVFVDPALVNQAYEDTSLPIGWGQTISKPSVVGRMLALLRQSALSTQFGHLGQVLEIGTGCGYQAALLAALAQRVCTIERVRGLHDLAVNHLRHPRLQGLAPLHTVFGDGRLGVPARAPFDHLIAAAFGEDIPPAWLEQLAVGGRLVAPVARPRGAGQQLVVVDRTAGGFEYQWLESVQFVPLKSGSN